MVGTVSDVCTACPYSAAEIDTFSLVYIYICGRTDSREKEKRRETESRVTYRLEVVRVLKLRYDISRRLFVGTVNQPHNPENKGITYLALECMYTKNTPTNSRSLPGESLVRSFVRLNLRAYASPYSLSRLPALDSTSPYSTLTRSPSLFPFLSRGRTPVRCKTPK